jgi:MFS family permease
VREGLIRSHADFRRLWTGAVVSDVGTQISTLAIPLIAAVTLHASGFTVGALTALAYAPYAVIGLPAGAWIDRLRRRPVMIAADLLRAGLLLTLPVGAATRTLSTPLLCAIAFAVGACAVFFEVADRAYLPSLIGRERLVEANARLSAGGSTARAIGPTLGGWLVTALTAPVAVLVDVVTYLVSAGALLSIRHTEPAPETGPRDLRREIADGFRLIARDPVLRAIAVYGTSSSTFIVFTGAIEILFLVRTVGVTPSAIGVLLGVASLGAVAGAFVGPPVRRRLGDIRALVATATVGNAFLLLVPLTEPGVRLAFFAVGVGVTSCGVIAFNVVSGAVTQMRCPDHLLGRMGATMRFIAWGALPVGALAAGALADRIGPRDALWVGAAGLALSPLLLIGIGADRKPVPAGPGEVADAETARNPVAAGQDRT